MRPNNRGRLNKPPKVTPRKTRQYFKAVKGGRWRVIERATEHGMLNYRVNHFVQPTQGINMQKLLFSQLRELRLLQMGGRHLYVQN